jgi:hypothetical protein
VNLQLCESSGGRVVLQLLAKLSSYKPSTRSIFSTMTDDFKMSHSEFPISLLSLCKIIRQLSSGVKLEPMWPQLLGKCV